jgi:hypothetical protein
VIGRVVRRGDSVRNVLRYLFGPGKANEHTDPHLVAAWGDPADLEPPVRRSGRRDFRRLTELLEFPVKLDRARGRAVGQYVWHCVVRAAPEDRDLDGAEWMAIAAELMHRTGLSVRGREDEGVRWVAVHHGHNHIHIVATLARQDGRPVRLRGDWWRIGEAMAWAERTYGLRVVARADRTAPKRPTRAETEKASRFQRPEPPRTVLRRQVEAAAAAARTEREFFSAMAARGVQVRLRYSTVRPDEVTGYAVALADDHTPGGGLVWFGGGRLAADLTLPKLRMRWADGPGRLTGKAMSSQTARVVLRREVLRAAQSARSEREFIHALGLAGLLVRLRPDPVKPGQAAGYAVSLPALADQGGQPVWFGGGTLDQRLRLGQMRARWRAGQRGAGPGPDYFAGGDLGEVYAHAATVARWAAREIKLGRTGRADIAWAAADVLNVAAEVTSSSELRRAADSFGRAARAPWGRVPAPSPGGAMLRTAAYLLAACRPGGQQLGTARRVLTYALIGLVRVVAELRAAQQRRMQAASAGQAVAYLTAVADNPPCEVGAAAGAGHPVASHPRYARRTSAGPYQRRTR